MLIELSRTIWIILIFLETDYLSAISINSLKPYSDNQIMCNWLSAVFRRHQEQRVIKSLSSIGIGILSFIKLS